MYSHSYIVLLLSIKYLGLQGTNRKCEDLGFAGESCMQCHGQEGFKWTYTREQEPPAALAMDKVSSDNSSSEGNDDYDGNFSVDWRALHLSEIVQ